MLQLYPFSGNICIVGGIRHRYGIEEKTGRIDHERN